MGKAKSKLGDMFWEGDCLHLDGWVYKAVERPDRQLVTVRCKDGGPEQEAEGCIKELTLLIQEPYRAVKLGNSRLEVFWCGWCRAYHTRIDGRWVLAYNNKEEESSGENSDCQAPSKESERITDQ